MSDPIRTIVTAQRRLLDMDCAVRGATGGDLTLEQAMIIAAMVDGMQISALQRFYGGANISYNVNKLAKLALIERGVLPTDRRAVTLTRTERGREVAHRMAQLLNRLVVGEAAAQLEAVA